MGSLCCIVVDVLCIIVSLLAITCYRCDASV